MRSITLTFSERLITIAVLAVTLQFSFPQFSHAAVPIGTQSRIDFSHAFVIGFMQNRGEVIEPAMEPVVVADRQRESNASSLYYPRRTLWVLVTAYSSEPRQTDTSPYITAKNTFVRDGVVAANFLPFNTRLRIPQYFGDAEFIVEDRMHDRFSNRIDIWMPTREQAKEWGAKWVKVLVL